MGALLSTGARLATMAVSLVCGVLTARLVISQGGVEAYAFLSLVVALPGLVMFADLGAGAVIVNTVATSKNPRTDALLTRQLRTVVRVMVSFAGGISLINIVMLATGGWSLVLGSTANIPHADLAVFVCVTLYALTICLGAWQRVLLGLRRNPTVILLQGLTSPLALLIVWLLLATDNTDLHSFLALGSFGASLIVAATGFVVATLSIGRILPGALVHVFSVRRHPGARVMDVGWPMLAQMLTNPLSVAVPRFLLAQLATHVAVAQYALAGQVFFALQSLIAAAGATLWPQFARARSNGTLRHGPAWASAAFGGFIALFTVGILVIGPWLFGFISDGELEVPPELILWFGAMMTAIAVLYPLGMFIMDKPGIRFQVVPSLAMAVSTIVLTVILTPSTGAIGPLIANTISVIVCQIVPYAMYIWRHRERLFRPAAEENSDGEQGTSGDELV